MGGPARASHHNCQDAEIEIRAVVEYDRAAVWGFMQQILAAGDTYCWPTDTTEERGTSVVDGQTWRSSTPRRRPTVPSWVPPNFIRISQRPAVTSPTKAPRCARPQPAKVSDAPWPAASWKSQPRMGRRRPCSGLAPDKTVQPPWPGDERPLRNATTQSAVSRDH